MSEKSKALYRMMIRKGYHEEFARLICRELETDFTAGRMIGYLAGNGKPRMEDVADEMLAILSDRDRLVEKHISEHAQDSINEWYRSEAEDEQ